ncbi:MAG TPA: hypothetical protein PK264_00050 [Hyphomicrobiaceae bacterium]|nr:hypothetical protein [Hyphomicrobiaceae bacterium]
MLPPLYELTLFLALSLAVTLYALIASGHFPAEGRRETLASPLGLVIIWGSMAIAVAALALALLLAWRRMPLAIAVIAFCAMGLVAPLVMKPMPDSFVDGRRGLLLTAGAAAALAALAWARI